MRCIYGFFILFLLGCSTSKELPTIAQRTVEKKSNPKIAFINLSLYKNKEAIYKAEIINTRVVEGRFKTNNNERQAQKKTSFSCLQLDKNFKSIDSIIIDDPFVKDIEYVDDSGRFQRKIVKMDSTKLSLRLQVKNTAKFISIKYKNKTLSRIDL